MPKLHLIPIKQQLQQLYSGLKKEKKQLQMKIKNKYILNIHHRHAIPPLVKSAVSLNQTFIQYDQYLIYNIVMEGMFYCRC